MIDIREKIFAENMKALKECYPSIAKKVEGVKLSSKYKIVNNDNGEFNLYISEHNDFYYDVTNTMKYVENEIDKFDHNNARVAVILGFGLGYELHVFNSKYAQKEYTSHFIIVEKDIEVLRVGLEITHIANLLRERKITFIIGESEKSLFSAFATHLKSSKYLPLIRTSKIFYTSRQMNYNFEYYKAAINAYREATVYALTNVGNSIEDSLMGVENMLINIAEIIKNPGVNLLYDKFKGKPAVVVSTGPSLSKNKHLLKGLEDKALIIAADSALNILLEMGVKPHMITMLERTIGPHKHIQGFDKELVKDTYLAACPVINNISYELYKGPRLIVYRAFDHFKWLGIDRGILNIKASAGNMSFKIAEALGCDPIILIGQDLAYNEENKTHAKGMVLGEEYHGITKIYKDFYVKGNYQEKILTNESWYKFLLGYVDDVAGYKGKCINATEGGAYIEGTELMTFKEAIQKYIEPVEPFYPLKKIKSYLNDFSIEKSIEDAKMFLSVVDRSLDDIQFMIDTCIQGIQEYDNHYEKLRKMAGSESLNDEEYEELRNIQSLLLGIKKSATERYETFQLLFMHIIQPFIVNHEIKLTKVTEKIKNKRVAIANQMLLYKEWFETVKKVGAIVKELVEKSKNEVIEKMKDIECS